MNFLSRFYFLTPWTIVHGLKGNFGSFEEIHLRGQISETGKATPTKFGFNAFYVNLYLYKIFEPILFFDPHGLSKGKFWQFLKANEKDQNLRNWRGHAHQNWFACVSSQPLLA